MNDQKKFYRNLKRDIKKDGNRQRRNHLKRSLMSHPEEAHWDEFDYGRSSSQWLNGYDEDGGYEDNYSDEDRDRGCNEPNWGGH